MTNRSPILQDASSEAAGAGFANLVREGDAARDQRNWEVAASKYAKALELRDQVGVRVQFAHMLKESGRLAEAEAQYFLARDANPNDADLVLQIGHFYWIKGDPAKSLEYYQTAAAMEPQSPSILRHVRIGERRLEESLFGGLEREAMAHLQAKRWGDAEQPLRELVKNGQEKYRILLGHALKEAGRFEEALPVYVASLDKARQGGDRSAVLDAELQLAHCLKLLRRYGEAARMFSDARQTRIDIEGWVGSVDELGDEVEVCLSRVYPSLKVGRALT